MARCWITFILIFPLLVTAQKFSAASLRQLKMYSTGVFSTGGKATSTAGFVPVFIKVQPLWQKRKDGIWLYTEKTDTAQVYAVWHFYLQDDTTIVMQLLNFKEKEKALQLSRNSKQASTLFLYDLFTKRGCEIYLKKNKTGYEGTSNGKDCMAEKPGTDYIIYHFSITKNSLEWREAGYTRDDKQLSADTLQLSKQVKSLK